MLHALYFIFRLLLIFLPIPIQVGKCVPYMYMYIDRTILLELNSSIVQYKLINSRNYNYSIKGCDYIVIHIIIIITV